MSFDTYDGLKAEIALWLERDDMTARIPSFIALAEVQMSRVLRSQGATGRSTATVTTEFSALPADYAEVMTVRVNDNSGSGWRELDPMTDNIMSDFVDATGTPNFYAIVGDEIRFYPTPSISMSCAMTYFQRVPPLSVSVSTNWVLASHPDAYLYGALSHAAPFLIDLEMAPVWKGLADAALGQILAERAQPPAKLRVDPALTRAARFNIQTGF